MRLLSITEHANNESNLTIICDHGTITGIVKQLGYDLDLTDGISFVDSNQDYRRFFDEHDQYASLWIKEGSEAQLRLNALGGIEWIRNLLRG